MAERLKATVLKTVRHVSVSGVRIPPPPLQTGVTQRRLIEITLERLVRSADSRPPAWLFQAIGAYCSLAKALSETPSSEKEVWDENGFAEAIRAVYRVTLLDLTTDQVTKVPHDRDRPSSRFGPNN